MNAAELVARLGVIREAMQSAMKENVDYGRVPGTDKPALFKPGAEKLGVLFQLDVQFVNEKTWGPGEHLTVTSRATVFHAPSGARLGYGEGICTTRERKYAYRKRDRACPVCGAATVIKGKDEYGGGWVCWKRRDGCGASFPDGDGAIESQVVGEIENPDLPDLWNTVVKMAKKRAQVDAVLAVTGASALFTQDLEDQATSTTTNVQDTPGLRYGPELDAAISRQAGLAVVKLAGGDPHAGIELWNQIRDRLDGYMPQAVAVALMIVAERDNNGSSAASAAQQDADVATPDPSGSQRARSSQPPPNIEVATAAATSAGPATTATAPRVGPSAAPDGGAAAQPNPHGAHVSAVARRRGVDRGELANLIRVAAGSQRLPADRAAAQLATLLERISERVARQTLELLDMLHPDEFAGGRGDVVGVDFAAFEPPAAA